MRRSLFVAMLFVATNVLAAAPLQESIVPVLGPKLFRDGDVVEITDVTATSPNLEQGDSLTVKVRVRLASCNSAELSLLVTQTDGDGSEETDATQTATVAKGVQDFELKLTIKHRGVLHLTFYDPRTGKPFGGVYFGTAEQMKPIANWDLRYYLGK